MSCIKGCLWYEKENGVKAIQQFVPKKYKIQFGVAQVDLDGVDNSVHTQPNFNHIRTKHSERRTWALLLSFKMQEGWDRTVHGIVLPREVALMNDDLQDRDNQIQAIKYDNVALQAQRDVY